MSVLAVRERPTGPSAEAGARIPGDGPLVAPCPGPPLSEAALSELWREQRFPRSALVTRQGVPLRVLHPGRPGRGAGPDFRHALLETPSGAVLRGDVELHALASSFRAHGHHRDPRYDRVILHVVFEDDLGEDTLLASGRRAPVVALAPWVDGRSRELAADLAQSTLWQEPCQGAGVRLGEAVVASVLEELGERRLSVKWARFEAALAAVGPEQALYEGLLRALGYGGNEEAMLLLARRLPWRELREALLRAPPALRQATAEALLLGTAGLLPSQRGHEGPLPAHPGLLEGLWRERRRAGLEVQRWRLWGIRPENQPTRRLAGAASLLTRHAQDLLAPVRGLLAAPRLSVVALLSPWTATAQGYWHQHFDLTGGACRLPAALIGRGRALEMAVNVVLPLATVLAEARRDGEAALRSRELLARLPRAGPYGVTRFLEEVLRNGAGRALRLNARRQQGLLHLYHAYCTEGGCGRCPLS